MAVIRITQPPGVTREMYDGVNAKMGVEENPPEGLIMHSAGNVNGTWQIVDVWESEEHARRFDTERLGHLLIRQPARLPNSRSPVSPSRWSPQAHTRHQRSPLGPNHCPSSSAAPSNGRPAWCRRRPAPSTPWARR